MSDEDGRSHDVGLAAEQAESARGFGAIGWFADNAPVELDQGVGGQNDVIGMVTRDSETFAQRVPTGGFAEGEVAEETSLTVGVTTSNSKPASASSCRRRGEAEARTRRGRRPLHGGGFHGVVAGCLSPGRSGIFISE